MTDVQAATAEATVAIDVPATSDTSLKGVGGWLLFLCISLTFLTPMVSLFNLGSAFLANQPFFGKYPGLFVLTMADMVVSIAILGFSVFVGISLWREYPRAVQAARIFLIVAAVYGIAAPFTGLLAGLPAAANEVILDMAILSAGRAAIYPLIWLNYLSRSKRVRNTFPDARYPGLARATS